MVNRTQSNGKAGILIVDDDPGILEMLSDYFTLKGHHVETALNGEEALEILRQTHHEVVITDIEMPVMNGVELLREINKRFPMIHVIIITGYVSLSNLLTTLRLGADTCVFKPFNDLTELEEAVEEALFRLNRWQLKLKELKDMEGTSDE